MFAPDILSLRQFYEIPLGMAVQSLIARSFAEMWPQADGDAVLSIGYVFPYAGQMPVQAKPFIVCMPAAQGAVYWPPGGANRVFLAHESELPIAENSMNRVLLVHCLEHTEQLSWLMQEIQRVLTPGGRVLAIVPNRVSPWSRSAASPFGYGRPFSAAQLRDLMTENHFTTLRICSALFVPPLHSRLCWRLAEQLERFGKWLGLNIGGVLLIEAEKKLYAPIQQPVPVKKTYRMPVTEAAPKPVMGREGSR